MSKAVQDRMLAVERIRDAFHTAVFAHRDATVAIEHVTEDVGFEVLPATRDAVVGADALRRHLDDVLLPGLPADLAFRRLSRTGDRWRVAQEDIATFTHDRELPWLLPGVAATGRRVEVVVMSVVNVPRSAVAHVRMLWDHAALLDQLVPSTRHATTPS